MLSADPRALLRPGLLEGIAIVLAGGGREEHPAGGLAAAVGELCAGLGAGVAHADVSVDGDPERREAAAGAALEEALAELGGASVGIVDGAGLFEGADRPQALLETLQACWELTRALAVRAFIPGSAGGRIILLAPPSLPGAGHAAAAAAGLENLARTLSIEWARYGITVLTLAPGAETTAEVLAALCAWLASPAGAYFSGCLLDLTGPRAARTPGRSPGVG